MSNTLSGLKEYLIEKKAKSQKLGMMTMDIEVLESPVSSPYNFKTQKSLVFNANKPDDFTFSNRENKKR
jgi:hypothetical protein